MIKEKQQSTVQGIIPFTTEEQQRLEMLRDKKSAGIFEVAFCGHFSAGKSTILNTLLGAEVLPTSPIPTSANIIEIKNGEQGLTVHSKKEAPKVWHGEIPWNKVREWGMNGGDISKMTITAPLQFLGDHSCILDTPGVDSTDESHEAVTVEQLYTTDAILYVMDYNHVQSETNLYFLKQLSLEKKLIYIVINQVDKHNEAEIPFSMFKKSVEDVFRSWEIKYMGMYFTSMKNQNHPLNQFSLLESELKGLLFQSKKLTEGSQLRLEHGFYHAVESRLQEEKQEAILEVISKMKEKGYDLDQLAEEQQLTQQLLSLNKYDEELWGQFDSELGKLFKNVTLFPATTTDKARDWIDSLQPGFRVGLLFTKKKTEEEQERRLEKLLIELQEKVKSQLLFHVQSFFQKVDRTKLSNIEAFEEGYSNLPFQITKEFLKKRVLTEHSNREYVFTFTGEITSEIVKELKNRAKSLVQIQISGLEQFVQREIEQLQQQLAKFKEIQNYSQKMDEIKTRYLIFIESVQEKLKQFPADRHFNEQIVKAMQGEYPKEQGSTFTNIVFENESVIEADALLEHQVSPISFSEEDTTRWLANVKKALLNHQKTTVLAGERNHLLERIERYEKQTFIISLFGAFSAGKSSFANALLGDNVLPVSPNPTTATVSTIQKATTQFPHGTVVVTLKSRQSLDKEIVAVAKELDAKLTLDNIEAWKPNMKEYVSSWQKTYAEYLLTIKNSLGESEWKLGTDLIVTLDDLQGLVADESKACLIEEVHIYYDAPITKKGIVLVDTPGVNSIHGRHTNVAFQQMRSSDAIFYLTYYNHAFSKADQYFLQQMAKVNESFQHDKLYFVINAADLAGSLGELNGVRKHVHDQLVRNGIATPRLYHLSSKEGLISKKQSSNIETSFSKFERAFYDYTVLELKQLSLNMITTELRQFINKANDSIAFMKEETATKVKKHEELKLIVEALVQKVEEAVFTYALRDVTHEFEQLVLYLRERMRFVLNDYFISAINVSVITGNSKKELQEQLVAQIKEWRGLGEYFLKQEFEATVIRMEEAIKERAKKWMIDEGVLIQKQLPFLYVDHEVEIEPLDVVLHDLHITIETNNYLPFIKSKKDFFEHGMVKNLKEVLVADGTEKASIVIDKSTQRYKQAFEDHFLLLENTLKDRLKDAIHHELSRFEALFDQKEQASLQEEYENLRKYLL
ncbi:dynamin family protein [Anaerobacillus isosaccharinicus]|uniref:Dynamin family GTPase n=1 Tax=Anaerobacillus isosaccharinicus TaxID=1532552 RepID=A0A1S2L6B4_9BACI|nr:dynamin family protein [Anaerobacillus isosaccharinicus]MBA5586933.1 dynamin family protein [Anaerobacillus isosaccharinicus]QOY34861.1 dynamin family GTPase [Anaerobacillus isosaccharinicus]